jgi:hypothetical protein
MVDRVITIAFQAQRPDLDRDLLRNVRGHLREYASRLLRISDEDASTFEEAGLYKPRTYAVWGDYDFATFYMGEDLESVAALSNSAIAPSQEFLFGSPYYVGDNPAPVLADVERLLELSGKAPDLVMVSRIKLGDHLLAVAGSELRQAMAAWIYDRAAACGGVKAVVLRCWSWPDLLVVLMGDDPRAMLDFSKAVEQAGLRELMGSSGSLEAALRRSLRHRVGRALLRSWVFGRGSERMGAKTILEELRRRDAVVAAKSQIAIPLPAGSDEPLYDLVTENIDLGSRPRQHELTRAQVVKLRGQLQKEGEKLAVELRADTALTARIILDAKPGHASFVQAFAMRIAEDLSACNSEVKAGTAGQSQAVILQLDVPPTVAGLRFLLRVSVSFRVCSHVRSQLSITETQLEWACDEPEQHSEAPRRATRGGRAPRTGYALLTPATPPRGLDFQRRLTTRRRVGRVEALALQAWHTAVEQMTGRPEMFGAMMEVQKGATIAYRELLLHPDAGGSLMAQSVLEMGEYFQRAYQQRLQFSPVVSGAPPINGQLPFGVNQIVRMVDGLAAVVTQAAFVAEPKSRSDPDLPARANVVVFEADPELATRAIHDFGVLKLSLLQAMTPLSLTLLFHELGHLIIRRSFWQHEGRDYIKFMGNRRLWWLDKHDAALDTLSHLTTSGVVPAGPGWQEATEIFLEDVFAHAVWRRVGCHGDWDTFVTQFLAGAAMGMRTRSPEGREEGPHLPEEFLHVWPTLVAQLLVQRLLSDGGESLDGLRATLDRLDIAETTREIVAEVVPFARGEYYYYRTATGHHDYADAGLEKLLTEHFEATWRYVLRVLAITQAAAGYWNKLERLFANLGKIVDRLERIDRSQRQSDAEYGLIRRRISRGQPVEGLPWQILQSDEGGCPSELAILWAREILTGVTDHFRAVCRRDLDAVSVRRDQNMEYAGIGKVQYRPGVFVDFAGGLFATGSKERLDYLKVRLAAIESLAALADRILAGPMKLRFERQRRYLRTPDLRKDEPVARGETVFAILDEHGQPGEPITATLVDQSPIGAGLSLPGRVPVGLRKDSKVVLRRIDGKERRCVVRWREELDGALHFGVEKLPDDAPETGEGWDEPTPEGEMEWVHLS